MSTQLVMVRRAHRPEHTPEAEPMVIDTDDPQRVVLQLDDGETVDCDAAELRAALEGPQERAA